MVTGPEPQIFIHARRFDNLPGVHDTLRIEQPLDLPERRGYLRPEHLGNPLASGQPVSMLGRHTSTKFQNHIAHALLQQAELGDSRW